MATYHGLVKATCLVCLWATDDDSTIEVMNDSDGTCPKCQNAFMRWENQDGSISISLTTDIDGLYSHENLVWSPK